MEVAIRKTCEDCGGPLGPGRDDRKYCSDACRTNFNNRKRKQLLRLANEEDALSVPDFITRIQGIILHNRVILESLCDDEHAHSIRMRDLVGKGFNPKFFTSEAEPTAGGNVYRFCFEYGYRLSDDGVAIVIRREREIH